VARVGLWDDQILPRLTDKLLGDAQIRKLRGKAVAGLRGTVVEIGFGSGLNVPLYPPEVEKVYAIEPSTVAKRLAAARVGASPVPVEFAGLDGQRLPLASESADAALSTFTLCTIPEVDLALMELYRVLKPGAELHFLEHGLSDDPGVVKWQHRFNGVQQFVCGGCNLDRPIDRLLVDAGFEVGEVEHEFMPGPRAMRPWGYLYEGRATKPAA
jgi:ubiquinone/menaquinone biosynthesis C-methylase UbiE